MTSKHHVEHPWSKTIHVSILSIDASCPSLRPHVRRELKKSAKLRYYIIGCSNIMSIVHLITRSNRCEQLPACRSCMHRGQSIIATLYNPRATRSVRYERSRGVFNCICSRRDGLYGKVGGLNVRPEPRHELGQTWGEPPWTGVWTSTVVRRRCPRYRHVWRFAKSARFHANAANAAEALGAELSAGDLCCTSARRKLSAIG